MGIGLHCAQLCWMDCLIETVKLQTVLSADYCRSTQHFSTDGSILYFVMCKYWALELKYSLSMCACLCVQVSRSSSTWARRWMGWIWGRRWAYWVVTSCSVVRWSPAAMAMRPANSSTLTRLEDIWRYTFGSLYAARGWALSSDCCRPICILGQLIWPYCNPWPWKQQMIKLCQLEVHLLAFSFSVNVEKSFVVKIMDSSTTTVPWQMNKVNLLLNTV